MVINKVHVSLNQESKVTNNAAKSPLPKDADEIKRVMEPKFSWRFLLPNYWLIWLGAGVLYTMTWLPYRVIRKLGFGFGMILHKIAPKRVEIARKNIALTFPDWPQDKVDEVFRANVQRTGMALFETAMGWWWPTWRVKKHCNVEGIEAIKEIIDSGKAVYGLAIHNVNLEIAARTIGLSHPCVAFYRKHNNPLMDFLQYKGRNRSNKYFIDKRNARALIQTLNQPELVIYLPDQDYGAKQSIFVPFGGVQKTATTTATLMFANRSNAIPYLITPQYTKDGYVTKFVSAIDYLADKDPQTALTRLNSDLLAMIEQQPESYLWMHKRFKTRPKEAPESLY